MKILKWEIDTKDLIIYGSLALFLILLNIVIIIMVIQRQATRKALAAEQVAEADSLAIVQAYADSLAMAEAAANQSSTTPMFDVDNPDLTEDERSLLRLQQYLYTLQHGEPEPPEAIVEVVVEPPVLDYKPLLDSTIVVMNAQIDSLLQIIDQKNQDKDSLQSTIVSKEGFINEQGDTITNLFAQIDSLRAEIVILNTPPPPPPPPVEVKEPDYKQMARIYNNMDAKKVAQLMQQLSADSSVRILKNMNARKKSQVMAALPPGVAARYTRLLMDI